MDLTIICHNLSYNQVLVLTLLMVSAMVQILGSPLASCWWLAASSCLARLAIWYNKAPGRPGGAGVVSWTIKKWDLTIKKLGLKHQNMFFHDLHWFIIYNPKKGIWDDLTIKHVFFNPQILMWSRTGPTNHGKSTGCIPRGCPTNRWVYPKVRQSGTDGKMKMNHHSLHGKMIGNTIGFGSTTVSDLAMDQYLLIPFLGGWTSIYQLFWCSPGVQGFDPSPSYFFFKRNYVVWSLHRCTKLSHVTWP